MNKIDVFFVCFSIYLAWLFAIFMIPAPYVNILYAGLASWYVGTRIGALAGDLTGSSYKAMYREISTVCDDQQRILDMQHNFTREQNDLIHMQHAKIDALMFEYCPDEMTANQIANYEKHQQPMRPH